MIFVAVTELTVAVTPVPVNETVAPVVNPAPLTTTVRWETPRASALGVSPEIVGFALTAKQPVHFDVPVSGLVTVTSRAPIVALLATVTLSVNDVALLRVSELSVMPVPDHFTVTPDWNPVPVTVTATCDAPTGRDAGVRLVTRGSATTVRQFAHVAVPPSELTTVTVCAPAVAVAPAVMLAVSLVAELRVTEFTVMPVPNETLPPPVPKFVRKFVPLTATLKV